MKLRGPMQMALPPCTSIASLTTRRMRSVRWYLTLAEITEGFSPRSTAPAVTDAELAADHPLHWNEDIATTIGAVLEWDGEREVAIADIDARRMGRDQRDGDAERPLLAD